MIEVGFCGFRRFLLSLEIIDDVIQCTHTHAHTVLTSYSEHTHFVRSSTPIKSNMKENCNRNKVLQTEREARTDKEVDIDRERISKGKGDLLVYM